MTTCINNNVVRKILPLSDINRILNIFGQCKLPFLQKIVEYSLDPKNSFIDFEWVEGTVIDEPSIQEAFYQLGLMHIECKISDVGNGFTTVCHGDFHRNNIIKNKNGIIFVDVTYLHEGWNFSDLCYLDLYNLYPKDGYPWYIKDKNCFESYLEGIQLICDEKTKEFIKKEITKNSLNECIQNGLKNGINVDFETGLLRGFSK